MTPISIRVSWEVSQVYERYLCELTSIMRLEGKNIWFTPLLGNWLVLLENVARVLNDFACTEPRHCQTVTQDDGRLLLTPRAWELTYP